MAFCALTFESRSSPAPPPRAGVTAMLTDSSAVRIQRAVRAYMSSRFDGASASAHKKAQQLAAMPRQQEKESSPAAATPVHKAIPSHATPPVGGQAFFGGVVGAGLGLPPTPYRTGRSPQPCSLMSPVRKTPPGGGGLPPMTPVDGDIGGVEREQVLSAWKKGIDNQVSIIHQQLIDSARKCTARSRSRSPPPGSAEKVCV